MKSSKKAAVQLSKEALIGLIVVSVLAIFLYFIINGVLSGLK